MERARKRSEIAAARGEPVKVVYPTQHRDGAPDPPQFTPNLPRQPLGLMANALPQFYLALRDGSLLVMQDKSKNPDGATGPQVCLATISPDTLATLLASKQPLELTP